VVGLKLFSKSVSQMFDYYRMLLLVRFAEN